MNRAETDGEIDRQIGETRPRKPWLAALLSFWQPGVGQLYCGRWRRAIACLLLYYGLIWAAFAAGLPLTLPGLIALLVLVLLCFAAILWDAVRMARGAHDYRLRLFNRWYVYLLAIVLPAVAASALVEAIPVRAFHIPSVSMEPTIRAGDRLMVDLTYWRDHEPRRGDLLVHAAADLPAALMLKRVVALGGETIEIRDKRVFINGRELADDWGVHLDPRVYGHDTTPATTARRDNLGPLEVPAGTLFLMGDNRDQSYDSRFHGPVALESLRGRPLYLYWAADKSRIGSSLR